ncbi:hypothetical protein PaeBR_09300 [Paenibacillus sp. BR2-3]|uniref:HipA family kinase n=1 Tax=Paenibacillus sp. BR2-3 TaxID=3048494 RepID=UPI0039774102
MKVHAMRHVKPMGQGRTLPHLFYCDDGYPYVVKLMNNEQGSGVLANEFIAFRLATLLNLPAAEYKIVNISSELVDVFPALKRLNVPAGPHIGCLFAEQAITLENKVDFSICQNIKDMAGMIVFDHWIMNWDRYVTGANLLFLQDTTQLLLIDHSNAFCGPDWDSRELEENSEDMEVYWGPFYEMFTPYIDGSDPFEPYLTVLEALDRRQLTRAVNGMPGKWKISRSMQESLVEFLYARKNLVRGAMLQLQDKFPIWSECSS